MVCADSLTDDSDLAQYASVADRLLRFEHGPLHSTITWLHAQCRGEWVLLLAGDEYPGPDLVAALPELVGSREAVQYRLSLRWLWPDAQRWLGGQPWHPDFQIRLARNDATLRFRGRLHELALSALPQKRMRPSDLASEPRPQRTRTNGGQRSRSTALSRLGSSLRVERSSTARTTYPKTRTSRCSRTSQSRMRRRSGACWTRRLRLSARLMTCHSGHGLRSSLSGQHAPSARAPSRPGSSHSQLRPSDCARASTTRSTCASATTATSAGPGAGPAAPRAPWLPLAG